MTKTIRNFLLLNFAFVILTVVVYAVGYEYDKANQLYPETLQVSYDFSVGNVYGLRWQRAVMVSSLFVVIADIVVGFIWYRKRQEEKVISHSSILNILNKN